MATFYLYTFSFASSTKRNSEVKHYTVNFIAVMLFKDTIAIFSMNSSYLLKRLGIVFTNNFIFKHLDSGIRHQVRFT